MRSSVPRVVSLSIAIAYFLFLQAYSVAAKEEHEESEGGTVYVMKNEAMDNRIVIFHRSEDGKLTSIGEVSTGGLGSGPAPAPPPFPPGPGPLPLDSQDSLISAQDGRFLIAVNAGSNDISVLAVTEHGLRVVDKAPSGGIYPVSVAYSHGLIYVINLGGRPTLTGTGSPGTPTLTGYFLEESGKLRAIPHSGRVIGEFGAGPADVVFSPDGRRLVVVERITALLDVFPVREDGTLENKIVTPSHSADPFGAAFTHHNVLVLTQSVDSAPRIPLPNGSTTSSYRLEEDGSLEPISDSVPTNQTAACWVRFSRDQRVAFVVNSGSGSVSTFEISPRGQLTLLEAVAADTGGPISAAVDEDITPNGKYLYVESPLLGELRSWRVGPDGSLAPLETLSGFPISMQGIIAR